LYAAKVLLMRDVEKALKTLAKREGCISCSHSMPSKDAPVYIFIRDCELGLKPGNCGRWERIEA
jgi:hypothetical protein